MNKLIHVPKGTHWTRMPPYSSSYLGEADLRELATHANARLLGGPTVRRLGPTITWQNSCDPTGLTTCGYFILVPKTYFWPGATETNEWGEVAP